MEGLGQEMRFDGRQAAAPPGEIRGDVNEEEKKRKGLEKHIAWNELPQDQRFDRLVTSRKRLSDTVKMIVYRTETAMANILRGPTISNPEARAIPRCLYDNDADILPGDDGKTLRVVVHGFPTPATERTVAKLFETLNQTETH